MAENNKKDTIWENLDWAKKVEVGQQGIAHEDSLLSTYVVIFIALEAMFFATVFSMKLALCYNITLAAFGILFAIWFVYIFKRTGDKVDRWGAVLYSLWQELSSREVSISGVQTEEFVKHYKGCIERRKRGFWAVIVGWCPFREWLKNLFKARRLITTYMPFSVIIVWAFIIVDLLDC